MNEETLFDLLTNSPVSERPAILDLHCVDKPQLRARLEALLAADGSPSVGINAAFLPFEMQGTHSYQSPVASAGAVVAGRYKLLQQIGEGGMGSVWMADQTMPVKRRVAIKLIRTDRSNSATILARFEAERQAIALMDHPHIARLLDAGTAEDGAPYFAMELVKGIPLTEYCDRHQLSVNERLQLFKQICGAVQHAHQKGIIHRDLKPSNILVESHDGKPIPKVIDFGLAKATTGLNLTENTLFTAFGTVLGTPLYMAPEQATFNASDVDTRVDIYALGIILYELLTGSTPLSRDVFKKAALDEVLRLVREQEAPTPSSRLSSSDAIPAIAANRKSEPVKLGRFIRGELDWITLKALSKERDRRYETADRFAEDIERFLSHEPVSAGPPSTLYRFKKFVRRNRGQVAAGSLVLATLVIGMIGTSIGYFRAERAAVRERDAREEADLARAKAIAERDEKEKARKRAEESEVLAKERLVQVEAEQKKTEEEKRIAQAVKTFLLDKLLGKADPTGQAISQLERSQNGDEGQNNPRILDLLAKASEELLPDQIEKHFPKQPLLQAELLETVGASYTGIGGKNNDQYSLALQFLERAFKLRAEHLGPYHLDTLYGINNLATAYLLAGEIDEALALYEEIFPVLENDFKLDHPLTLGVMGSIAKCYLAQGKLDQALPVFEKAVEGIKATKGPNHPDSLKMSIYLARAYRADGQFDRAIEMLEKDLDTARATFGPGDYRTAIAMGDLAAAYQATGKYAQALRIEEEALTLLKAQLGEEHPHVLMTMDNIAGCLIDVGEVEKGLAKYDETLALMKTKLGSNHPETLICMSNFAYALQSADHSDRALPLLESVALETEKKQFLLDGARERILRTIAAYSEAKQFSRADAWRDKWLRHLKTSAGADSPEYAGELAAQGLSLIQSDRCAEAEPILRECLGIRQSSQSEDWKTYNTMSLLGGALAGKAKHDKESDSNPTPDHTEDIYREAELLLRNGYEGMKQREAMIPPTGKIRLLEACDRLIKLYTDLQKIDEASKWKAEKDKLGEENANPPKQSP